ncbi:uncharacterized protein BJ212DRAFT_967964 [Suillus subaureus]|uniref:Uncharacterized protein n=1 Tax=Suillus subaureus TaxID=48587 RepID=A0A9P7JGE9_9AGAM|nr:uncharacterized protein BJ212DRAFT_967964 [Suillus subaureus]KAG1820903.1 hypothetical protein BJ212DRAFT_967964 [Suillus subaureus]
MSLPRAFVIEAYTRALDTDDCRRSISVITDLDIRWPILHITPALHAQSVTTSLQPGGLELKVPSKVNHVNKGHQRSPSRDALTLPRHALEPNL